MSTSSPRKSIFLSLIYVVIAMIAMWILLMPWVPAIAAVSMRRFHLTSSSFVWWAIQQPIPSMYNFCNTFEIRQWPPGVTNSLVSDPLFFDLSSDKTIDFGKIHADHINHFPSRVLTFSDHRIHCCSSNQNRWLVTVSTYRGQRIETLTQAKPVGGGRFLLTRTELLADEAISP